MRCYCYYFRFTGFSLCSLYGGVGSGSSIGGGYNGGVNSSVINSDGCEKQSTGGNRGWKKSLQLKHDIESVTTPTRAATETPAVLTAAVGKVAANGWWCVTLFGRGGRGSEELSLPRDEGLQQENGLVIPHPGVHLPA
jgi:hypothetical protein